MVISLLIAILCSGVILISNWHYQSSETYLEEQRLLNNCKSGLTILQGRSDFTEKSELIIDLFEEGKDSVLLSKKSWGLYEIGTSTAFSRQNKISKTILLGDDISTKDRFALYLADRNSPLSLCGQTLIRGKAYLPKAGVKRAYIEGQTYVGTTLVDGLTAKSENRIPSLPKRLLDDNNIWDFQDNSKYETLAFQNLDSLNLKRSYLEKTLVVHIEDSLALFDVTYSGNIIVYSKAPLYVRNTCSFDKILVYAPKIYLEKNVQINAQLFARERIEVGTNCVLSFPSVLAIIPIGSSNESFINIEKNSQIFGTVLIAKNGQTESHRILVQENSLVTGQVYTHGKADVKGKIYGSLICTELQLKTPSAMYDNHLLNAEINAALLPEYYTGVALLDNGAKKHVLSYPL